MLPSDCCFRVLGGRTKRIKDPFVFVATRLLNSMCSTFCIKLVILFHVTYSFIFVLCVYILYLGFGFVFINTKIVYQCGHDMARHFVAKKQTNRFSSIFEGNVEVGLVRCPHTFGQKVLVPIQ